MASDRVRTLLVDDVEGLRRLYRTILEGDGRFEVVGEAGTGDQAIDRARDLDPDLVLLDISMPGMDGLEALPEIRDEATDATVVILSGFVEDRLGEKARKRGAADYLEKGISPPEMIDRLCDVLELNGRPAATPQTDPTPSDRELDTFAYAASHDLQEPLRMVRSYLDLLADRYGDDLDAEALEFLDYAADGAERMQAMIDGLLAYGRVETRGDPLEPVDLDDVLDDVIANLDLAIRETGADVVRGDLPVVEGDRGQLVQLFQNLVANALQYHDGSPRIRIDADRDGDRWTVSVADDGIGIPKDQQDRIFAIFQRGPGSQHGEGTGVGLAMCRRIVERHGGVIAVESTPGEGSTFTFTLPAVDEARRTEGRRAAT